MDTIAELLQRGADDAAAIGAPEAVPPLRYRDLRALIERTVAELNSFGIGRGDRVVLVLPNGPEAATAFLAVGAGATTAPLSRGLTADEFEFNLTDLRAKALVVEAGLDSPARAVATKLRIPIIELVPHRDQGAGAFSLRLLQKNGAGPFEGGLAQPDDVALVLHTSGSTSRPKIVPLLHRNVTASARNIMGALQLTPPDVCLNIMPLFHIHGLMAAVLASLGAGAQVCCTPGFNALRFFHWLEEVHPTWTTGVPTMHRAILSRGERNPEILARRRLRLIRSSSASLRPRLMEQLEAAFQAPVIEAYGMTEASHQMASNPLPPRPRKPGTVGLAAGPEIGIMDPEGKLLPQGASGEIVV